jgi:hypothetical protein
MPAQVLDRGAQAAPCDAARYASQVLDRCAQAVARGPASCASQVLDRGAQTGPVAPLVVRRR